MNVPGMPPQYADKMKQEIAAHRNDTSKHCIKPEDVKKPKEDFFGAEKTSSGYGRRPSGVSVSASRRKRSCAG